MASRLNCALCVLLLHILAPLASKAWISCLTQPHKFKDNSLGFCPYPINDPHRQSATMMSQYLDHSGIQFSFQSTCPAFFQFMTFLGYLLAVIIPIADSLWLGHNGMKLGLKILTWCSKLLAWMQLANLSAVQAMAAPVQAMVAPLHPLTAPQQKFTSTIGLNFNLDPNADNSRFADLVSESKRRFFLPTPQNESLFKPNQSCQGSC